MTTSAPSTRLPHVGEDLGAEALGGGRQQRRRRRDAHARAERVEHDDVGAGDAAVQDVAADGDGQAGDAALGAADGERVEQRLRRVLVRAVAGVDHRAVDLLRQELDGAGRVMAHDDDVGAHGVERHGRVDQRLALRHRRGRDVHVHDVGAEALGRHLERALRARRGFEEQVDQRAAAQHVALLAGLAVVVGGLVGEIEQKIDL